jgi:hypothetical protein
MEFCSLAKFRKPTSTLEEEPGNVCSHYLDQKNFDQDMIATDNILI